ncbi:SnoaL-like polyketide cyclase [Streptomyces sp. YIM 121038]|uniref:ester cyclase n=1 Tax=Streptomyces sp. YIM 121038 TaxID=2136401 RepID=UPI001110EAA0|nr:ester cyclase [Streptomyces sp. YIM 121038]QCX81760.1 SnoaL-like polyketide cyclase [Streptomyces sp. YIM 121038]
MSEQTVAHAFAALMNGHDPDAVDGFVAEDYVNHNPYVEDGREANRAFWGRWFAAFPDTRVTLEDVLVDGDRVAGRFTYRATHLGSLLGEEPTGRPVEMRSLDIWRVQDGMAVEHWDELNTLEFFTQLGLLAPMTMPGARSQEEGDAS